MEISSSPVRNTTLSLYPFIKWVGGKTKYIQDILPFFPKEYDRYYEPFIGGGAIFLHLQPRRAYISDVNIELINCYQVIHRDVNNLMKELERYIHKNTEQAYYEIRDQYNQLKKEYPYSYDDDGSSDEHYQKCITKSGMFIYLNKTSFRGIYRENKSGGMNVPYGNYKSVTLYEQTNLLNIHQYLNQNDIMICHHSYDRISPTENDFIYIDPPYDQEKKTDFVSYTKDGGLSQKDLFQFVQSLPSFVLSNSPTTYIQTLYKDYPQKILTGKRNVDVKKEKTVKPIEIIICSRHLLL
jgi:DNA adenine methylase